MFGLEKLFDRKPSRQDLVEDLMKRLAQSRPSETFTYDEALFQIKSTGSFMNLSNLFADYCSAAKTQRVELVEKFLRGMVAPKMPTSFSEARAKRIAWVRCVS